MAINRVTDRLRRCYAVKRIVEMSNCTWEVVMIGILAIIACLPCHLRVGGREEESGSSGDLQ